MTHRLSAAKSIDVYRLVLSICFYSLVSSKEMLFRSLFGILLLRRVRWGRRERQWLSQIQMIALFELNFPISFDHIYRGEKVDNSPAILEFPLMRRISCFLNQMVYSWISGRRRSAFCLQGGSMTIHSAWGRHPKKSRWVHHPKLLFLLHFVLDRLCIILNDWFLCRLFQVHHRNYFG